MFFPLGRCTLYTKTKHQDQQMECQAASATHETLALEHAKQLCSNNRSAPHLPRYLLLLVSGR